MIYIGIDPGKEGGIACITKIGMKRARSTPVIKKEYDLPEMCRILESFKNMDGNLHVVLENINGHVARGRTTAFVMGKGVGYWHAMLVALKIPYTLVAPQVWQKEMWSGVTAQRKAPKEGRKTGSVDTKATSLLAAQRLFPEFDFRKSEKSTKPHDGMVDAMLMADYCRRKF